MLHQTLLFAERFGFLQMIRFLIHSSEGQLYKVYNTPHLRSSYLCQQRYTGEGLVVNRKSFKPHKSYVLDYLGFQEV